MSANQPSFLGPSRVAPTPLSFLVQPVVAPTPEEMKKLQKGLLIERFELAFPRLIDRMYGGETINAILNDFPVKIERGAFMRWIKKDASRFAIYTEAKETRTEIWTGELVSIAEGSTDANGDLIELDRAKLIIDTYKFLIKAENRKGYGDTKSIEMTGNISLIAALSAAETRVQQIAAFTDDDEPEPTMKQLTEAVDADWEEVDDDD